MSNSLNVVDGWHIVECKFLTEYCDWVKMYQTSITIFLKTLKNIITKSILMKNILAHWPQLIKNISIVAQNKKKFAMLFQQLEIWSQSSELTELLKNFQPLRGFSYILTTYLDSYFITPRDQFLCICVDYFYEHTSKFALTSEQKKSAHKVNLHLVVTISTDHDTRTCYEI